MVLGVAHCGMMHPWQVPNVSRKSRVRFPYRFQLTVTKMKCAQCGVEFTQGGRESKLCSYCYIYGDNCNDCLVKQFCKNKAK